MAGARAASDALLGKQLMLLGRVLRADRGNPVTTVSFIPGTWQPATDRFVRRVGRPWEEWVPEFLGKARAIVGGDGHLANVVHDVSQWRRVISQR